MKTGQQLLWIVPSLLLFSGTLGFALALPFSGQVAAARLLIDGGVLVAAVYFIHRLLPLPQKLKTEELVDAVRELVKGHYDKRLNDQEFGELEGIARVFNELAGTLSDSHALNRESLRYRPFLSRQTVWREQHSHHPEIGPVQPFYERSSIEQLSLHERIEQTMMAERQSPAVEEQNIFEEDRLQPTQEEPEKEQKEAMAQEELPPEDLELLYQSFSDAHQKLNRMAVDFGLFKATIDQTREQLVSSHQCKAVRFEVVVDSGEVALQPRLLR